MQRTFARRVPLVLFGGALCAAASAHGAELADARAAVGALYKTHFAKGQRWDITLESERARFAASLLRMLDDDQAAQRATPGEVVGLDHDPLTGGQDEADRYVVGSPRADRADALVPVEIGMGDARKTLTIRLALLEGRWKISNVHDGRDDLVATLRRLKAER